MRYLRTRIFRVFNRRLLEDLLMVYRVDYKPYDMKNHEDMQGFEIHLTSRTPMPDRKMIYEVLARFE